MAKTKKTEPSESIQFLKIHLEPRQETPFYYVNYISIASSSNEFVIGAVRVPFPLTGDQLEQLQKRGHLIIEPTIQLVVPPPVAKALIKALTEQVTKFEAQFGEILPGVKQDDEGKLQ